MNRFKSLIVTVLVGVLCIGSAAAQHPGITLKTDSLPTALLIIDEQDFYFPGGKLPLVNPEAASEKTAQVLKMFRDQHLPVIHIQHAGGSPVHKNVAPLPGEKLITKKEANGFNGTDLLATLLSLKIKRVVICGMQTQMCVEATTRAAYDFGFRCILVEDACATRNLTYGSLTVPADDIQAAVLATLKGYYAEVVKSADLR